MKKRRIAATLGVCLLAALGTGCGQSPEQSVDMDRQDVAATEEEVEVLPTETEETNLPYAERYGFEFDSRLAWEAPYYCYFRNIENDNAEEISVPGYSLEYGDAKYQIGDITKSEPDGDGMITVQIPYIISTSYDLLANNNEVEPGSVVYPSQEYATLGVFDYYTGQRIPEKENAQIGEVNEYMQEYTYADKTYQIGYTMESQSNYEDGEWQTTDNVNYRLTSEGRADIILTVKMPENYDGLCLSFCKGGQTKLSESDGEGYSESLPFLETLDEGETINDYYFIRLKDIM